MVVQNKLLIITSFLYLFSYSFAHNTNNIYLYYVSLCWAVILLAILIKRKITFKRQIVIKNVYDMNISIFFAFFIYFIFDIYLTIDLNLMFNRFNRELEFFASQSWVVFVIFSQSLFFFCIYNYNKINVLNKFLLITSILLFITLEVFFLGARRFSVAIIIFLLVTNKGFRSFFEKKIGTVVIVCTIGLVLLFGGLREFIFHATSYDFTSLIHLTFKNNEFTEIGRGINSYISRIDNGDFEFLIGESYFNTLSYLIPNSIHPDKPPSLVQISGLPSSLYSEAFANFYIVGIFIVFLLAYVFSCFKEYTIVSATIFSYVLDFQRTEFGLIIYTLVLSIIFYNFFGRLVYKKC